MREPTMMTTTRPMTRPRNLQPTDPSQHSLLKAMPTHLVALSPEFLQAVRRVAPRRRRAAGWVLALAVLAAAIGVGVVPSARQRVLAAIAHRFPAAAALATTPTTSALSAPSAPKLDAVPAESAVAELPLPAPSAPSGSTVSASASPKSISPQRKSPRRAPR
jgi:hypothetical protein